MWAGGLPWLPQAPFWPSSWSNSTQHEASWSVHICPVLCPGHLTGRTLMSWSMMEKNDRDSQDLRTRRADEAARAVQTVKGQ